MLLTEISTRPFLTLLEAVDLILFQHLFWIFGHPAVYNLVLLGSGRIHQAVKAFL